MKIKAYCKTKAKLKTKPKLAKLKYFAVISLRGFFVVCFFNDGVYYIRGYDVVGFLTLRSVESLTSAGHNVIAVYETLFPLKFSHFAAVDLDAKSFWFFLSKFARIVS